MKKKKIKIYRTGWELYQGRGVWNTYYTDWTTDKKEADKQFLELTEFYKDYPAASHCVLKVESSKLSVDSRSITPTKEVAKEGVEVGEKEVVERVCEILKKYLFNAPISQHTVDGYRYTILQCQCRFATVEDLLMVLRDEMEV